jgi:hypothetical protein
MLTTKLSSLILGFTLALSLSSAHASSGAFDHQWTNPQSQELHALTEIYNGFVQSLNLGSSHTDVRAVGAKVLEWPHYIPDEEMVKDFLIESRMLVSPYNVPDLITIEHVFQPAPNENPYILASSILEHSLSYVAGRIHPRDIHALEDMFAWQLKDMRNLLIFTISDRNPWAHCTVTVVVDSLVDIAAFESCIVE